MYDKFKIWIDRAAAGVQCDAIASTLSGANTQIDHTTGEVKTFGYIGGLKVCNFVGGLSITGSLPKFLHGSNIYSLDRKSTARAIEKLSDELHIDVSASSVTELEFGTNFLMRYKVQDYLCKLGDMPRLLRYHFEPKTLYYKGKGRKTPKVFTFYDKQAEAEQKAMPYLDGLKEANVLRYEMRFSGRLPYQFSVPEVRASTLYDRAFYKAMIKRYQDNYFSISKQNQVKTNIMSEIKTVSDAFSVFVARLMSQTDQTEIGGFIDELKRAGVFSDRNNYSRLRKKIQEVAARANIYMSDELIKELDDDVKNCGAYV